MRVLFLTYFYPPDLCAGAFRSEALLSAFGRCAKINSLEVDVLTTQPHRYSTYSSDSAGSESFGFGVIKRFPNVHSSKGRAGDVRNFLKYASNVRHAVKKKKWDLYWSEEFYEFWYKNFNLSQHKKILNTIILNLLIVRLSFIILIIFL